MNRDSTTVGRRPRAHRTRWVGVLVVACLIGPTVVAAAQSGADIMAIDALRCWRRVSRHAVAVGERFTMTVTCSVVETDDARTLPDQTALEPQTIDVAPFEVLDGERYDDVRTGPYRFFQYLYTLRLITEQRFGEDVEIPALELSYRIERRLEDNPALLGRELRYLLPAEPIRVLSLVPEAIVDIRDLPPATFGDAQARELRASLLTLLATLFGFLAVGVVALGALRVARERRGTERPVDRRLPLPLVAHHAFAELTRVRETTATHPWTAELTGRALAALRVAASVAVAEPVAQTPIDEGTAAREGQLRVPHGWRRGKTSVVSSGLTSTVLARRLEAGPTPPPGLDRSVVTDLQQALLVFTAARYGRESELPAGRTLELTRQLDTSIARTRDLRWRSAAAARQATRLMESVRDRWVRWTR